MPRPTPVARDRQALWYGKETTSGPHEWHDPRSLLRRNGWDQLGYFLNNRLRHKRFLEVGRLGIHTV